MKSKFDFKGPNYINLKVSNNKITTHPNSSIFGVIIMLLGLFCIYVVSSIEIYENWILFLAVLTLGIFVFFLGLKGILIKDSYEFSRVSKKYKRRRRYLLLKKDSIKTGNFKDFELLKLTFGISSAGLVTWDISLKTKKGEDISLISKDVWSFKKNANAFTNAILFFSEFFGVGYLLKINNNAKEKYFSALLKNNLNLDKKSNKDLA